MIELWSAFILGLVGSLHCAGMCGPFAMALPPGAGSAPRFFFRRIAYNFGRIVTYCALGLTFGLAGKLLWLAGVQRWLSLALGILFLAGLFATRRRLAFAGKTSIWINRLKGPLAAALHRPSLFSAALVGLLNGLLPCGLVYVASAASGTSGSPLRALAYMAAFGAGTFPMMLGIGLSGRLLPLPLRLKLQRVVPVTVFLLATILILRSLNLSLPGFLDHFDGHCCVTK